MCVEMVFDIYVLLTLQRHFVIITYLSLLKQRELGLRGFDGLVRFPLLQEILGYELDHFLWSDNKAHAHTKGNFMRNRL